MGWQILLGLPLACAVFGLALAVVRTGDAARRTLLLSRVRRIVLAYAVAAFGIALFHWWDHRDWVHLLWTSVHPQFFVFLGVGAFLAGDDARRRAGSSRPGRSTWIAVAVLFAFAVLPAALIEWVPRPNVGPRNLGRPVAGAFEVARLGLGGPVPEMLVPENDAGAERGLGFLPREITVTIGGLVAFASLWIATCAIALAGAFVRSSRARLGVLLFAPFAVGTAMLFGPMPFGFVERALWESDPRLLRAFGPLLVAALAAGALPWLARGAGRKRERAATPDAPRPPRVRSEFRAAGEEL